MSGTKWDWKFPKKGCKMKVGIIGLGKMGEAMAGHVLTRGEDSLAVFDLDSIPVDRVSEKGSA